MNPFSIIHKHPYKSKQSMNLSPLSVALRLFLFFFFFFFFFFTITFSTADVSINCGSSATSAATNGRQWLRDSLVQLNGVSTTSTVVYKLSSADPVPHSTARISRSRFSYAFQLNPGQIIIHLHFNPSPYKGFKRLKDLFSVEAGPFTLLSNFSASLTAAALGVTTFTKEFYVSIEENQTLSITFSAVTSSQSGYSTYAFINGIEIISVPMHLSYFKAGDLGALVVGKKSFIYVDSSTALELIHRVNVKQDSVLATDEFDDVLCVWGKVPKPKENERKNISFKIPVDVGFRYLVRIHFSNTGLKKALSEGVIFKVQINGKIVDTNVDILEEKEDHGILRYRDYMSAMNGRKQEGKRDLLISFQSYDEFMDGYKLIKGFEIFKLSNHDNSLAGPNTMLPKIRESQSLIIRNLELFVGYRNAIATVVLTIVVVVNIIVYMFREIWEATSIEEENKPSARAERLCRRFSLTEMQLATRNFSDGLLIGRGGFGQVYKGLIDRGQSTVAIKRLKCSSRQGAHEFLTEIETLSELRHINLVSLIGYCNERGEMILVYDYMAGGTLADHLYKLQRENNDVSSLTWKQRLNICIGAGRGLDYLHTGHGVIHRDVKASNILLDESFVAKVSDFGLAKLEDRSTLNTHVSTYVKGTKGYLDPHYIYTSHLTRKSDVYAFGVVLLEVLCGRPPLDWGVSEDERILIMWARNKISKGEADEIVALTLREEIAPNSLKTFVGIAERCLHDDPKNRPRMSQIVLQLEDALEQQDNQQHSSSSASADMEQTVSTVNTTTASLDVHNILHLPQEQSDSNPVNPELPSGRNFGRKAKTYKQSRFWPWETFWNRANPSLEIDSLLLGTMQKFTLRQIKAATNNFDPVNEIGVGCCGRVYKGMLSDGTAVAVKQCTSEFKQDAVNEIVLLSALKHINLVELYGYCIIDEGNLFLIREFMENYSVSDALFGEDTTQKLKLNWPTRTKICLGVARGLAYLYEESKINVIHRDIKTKNILLDKNLNCKISDFSVAKRVEDDESHITTLVVGTWGYLDPDYLACSKLTNKADVYSFGVVVLEIVSGKRSIYKNEQNEMMVMNPLARDLQERGRLLELVDPGLGSAYSSKEAMALLNLAILCTDLDPIRRPTMYQVVSILRGGPPM